MNSTRTEASSNLSVEQDEQLISPAENISLFHCYLLLRRDLELRRLFEVFRNESISITSIVLLNVLITFLIYPQMITQMSRDDRIIETIEILLTIIAFISNWGYTFIVAMPTFVKLSGPPSGSLRSVMRSAAIITLTIALSFHLLHRDHKHDYLPLFQTQYGSHRQFFEVCPVLLMVLPIALIVITREYRFSHVLFVFLSCVFTLIFISANRNILNYPNIIVFVAVGGLILFDCVRQQLSQFFRKQQLLKKLLLQERSAETVRRQEMRHMIANVAHDLKSPLASFMNGVELIQADSEYLQRLIKGPTENKTFSEVEIGNSLEAITSILSTTHYVQNINNFMLMTINRCLDSTKASNGLKLVPKNETIALLETLSLPIECLATTQQKIGIELIPWDFEKISPCIITDKQWLQENILCLLSNAIKYSYEGKVTIAVQLRAKRFFEEREGDFTIQVEERRRLSNANDDSLLTVSLPMKTRQAPVSQPVSFLGRLLSGNSRNHRNSSNGHLARFLSGVLPPKFKVAPDQILPAFEPPSAVPKNAKINPSIQFFSFYNTSDPEESNVHEEDINTAAVTPHSNLNRSHQQLQQEGDQPYLVFEIEDTGIGMSDQAREQLFNPFQQNQRLAGGTGLGLYSLAKRIEALKGYYGVEKRRDGKEGSLFWFAIPYHPDYVMEKVMTSRRNVEQNDRNMIHPPSPIPTLERNCNRSQSPKSHTERLYPSRRLSPFPVIDHHLPSTDISVKRYPSERETTAELRYEGFQSHKNTRTSFFPSSITVDPSQILNRASITALDLAIAVASARDTLKQSIDSQQTPSYRILIADDAVTVAKVMKRLLERHGHEVEIVENGAAAVKVIQQTMEALIEQSEATASRTEPSLEVYTPPLSATTSPRLIKGFDLLLMDLHMPIMDGLEATKRIRQLEQERNAMNSNNVWPVFHQKIICVSANGSEETVAAVTESGMDGFIPKPFTYEIFLNAVQSLLQTQPQQ